MRKLFNYHFEPLQIRSVVSDQANQIKPRFQTSTASHATEHRTPRAKPLEVVEIYCLFQNAIDRQLVEIDLSISRDPWRKSRRRAVHGHLYPVYPHTPMRGEFTTGSNKSEEHTSELQSLAYLVCRLLLEKKKKQVNTSPLMQSDHECM